MDGETGAAAAATAAVVRNGNEDVADAAAAADSFGVADVGNDVLFLAKLRLGERERKCVRERERKHKTKMNAVFFFVFFVLFRLKRCVCMRGWR